MSGFFATLLEIAGNAAVAGIEAHAQCETPKKRKKGTSCTPCAAHARALAMKAQGKALAGKR